MGYAHYYRGWASLDASFIETVRAFADASGVIIEGGEGEGAPTLESENEICFNGAALLGDDHETFLLMHGVNHSTFCKTGRRAYDIVVCATLLLATARNKGFKVSSDGAWDSEAWQAARALYLRVTGQEAIQPQEMGGPGNSSRVHDGGFAHGVRRVIG